MYNRCVPSEDWLPSVEITVANISLVLLFQVGLISFVLGLLRLGFLDVVLSRALLRGFITAVVSLFLVRLLTFILYDTIDSCRRSSSWSNKQSRCLGSKQYNIVYRPNPFPSLRKSSLSSNTSIKHSRPLSTDSPS